MQMRRKNVRGVRMLGSIRYAEHDCARAVTKQHRDIAASVVFFTPLE